VPDGQSSKKPKPQAPSPPSRRALPHISPPDDGDTSVIAELQRLGAYAYPLAEKLRAKAVDITGDPDLSDQGKRRKLAKETAAELSKFQHRLTEERKALAKERDRLGEKVEKRVRDAAGKLSDNELAEWRAALRALPPQERSQVLRDAASGRGPGAEAIMCAAASAANPILIGLAPTDPTYAVTIGQHRQRLAEAELQAVAELDQTQADAEQALAQARRLGRTGRRRDEDLEPGRPDGAAPHHRPRHDGGGALVPLLRAGGSGAAVAEEHP
jgi:hypothetical protein